MAEYNSFREAARRRLEKHKKMNVVTNKSIEETKATGQHLGKSNLKNFPKGKKK